MILFKIVIMRVYLGRKPCDDGQIFFLAYQAAGNRAEILPDDPLAEAKLGSLRRNRTLPERVMDSTARSSHRLRCEVKRIEFPRDFLLVSALDGKGQPYQFFHTTATGLYNSKPFVPRFRDPRFLKSLKYTPSPEQVPKPRPLPKPKPTALSKGPALTPSQPRLMMHNYNPTDSQNQPHPTVTDSKPTKRQRSDDDGLFVPVSSTSKSNPRKTKRQRNREGDSPVLAPQQVLPPRRSGRLNK